MGWITNWALVSQSGSTLVVVRDGNLLTIRSLAGTPQTTRANAEATLAALLPQVVGD